MSDKRLFDYDPLTGETQWFVANDEDDTFTIQSQQNVEDILEANKDHYNQFNSVRDPYGDRIGASTRVATIPVNLYYHLVKQFGRDPVAWKRWLNDPSNRGFRTRPGAV